MIRRIKSKGSSEESSRRPMIRMSRKRKRKTTTPRPTMSITDAPALRIHRHFTVDVHEPFPAVIEGHVGMAPADVRRAHLELHEQPELLAGRNVSEREE